MDVDNINIEKGFIKSSDALRIDKARNKIPNFE